jgi:hypothetical protein
MVGVRERERERETKNNHNYTESDIETCKNLLRHTCIVRERDKRPTITQIQTNKDAYTRSDTQA